MLVEVYLDEAPLRNEHVEFTASVFCSSAFIVSVIAAAAVYVAMQWLAVASAAGASPKRSRPFQQAPEDPARHHRTLRSQGRSGRGRKKRSPPCSAKLRQALLEKERLAGGRYGCHKKFSHDLKNIPRHPPRSKLDGP